MPVLASFPQCRHDRAAGGELYLVAVAAGGACHRQAPGEPTERAGWEGKTSQ